MPCWPKINDFRLLKGCYHWRPPRAAQALKSRAGCRRAANHASTTGRGIEGVSQGVKPDSHWHIRPSRFAALDRQFSSNASGTPHSSTGQDTPQSLSRSWSRNLSFDTRLAAKDVSLDFMSQKLQKESLLELLKQRAGSQELSSQVGSGFYQPATELILYGTS